MDQLIVQLDSAYVFFRNCFDREFCFYLCFFMVIEMNSFDV